MRDIKNEERSYAWPSVIPPSISVTGGSSRTVELWVASLPFVMSQRACVWTLHLLECTLKKGQQVEAQVGNLFIIMTSCRHELMSSVLRVSFVSVFGLVTSCFILKPFPPHVSASLHFLCVSPTMFGSSSLSWTPLRCVLSFLLLPVPC